MKTALHTVRMAFEPSGVTLPIADIIPLRLVSDAIKKSAKYAQISASIREIGIIEPPIVARDPSERGKYLLLDGHLRIEILKEMGKTEVFCLISTDDEAFTYNKRVNRIAIIQEHRMILKASERGVSDERIARALNVNVDDIRRKRHLLDGICPEVVEILKDRHVPLHTFTHLRKMTPIRQIEAAELMEAMNKYSVSYAQSLVAATPREQLVSPPKQRKMRGVLNEQRDLMAKESANLDREFKMIQQSYGSDHLDLVLAKGYLAKLVGNPRIARYLAQHYPEILAEFQKIAELESTGVPAVGPFG